MAEDAKTLLTGARVPALIVTSWRLQSYPHLPGTMTQLEGKSLSMALMNIWLTARPPSIAWHRSCLQRMIQRTIQPASTAVHWRDLSTLPLNQSLVPQQSHRNTRLHKSGEEILKAKRSKWGAKRSKLEGKGNKSAGTWCTIRATMGSTAFQVYSPSISTPRQLVSVICVVGSIYRARHYEV